MAVLKVTFGTLDKASADEVYSLAQGAAVKIAREVDRYSRLCLEGGKEGTPDPHHGKPCFIVRIAAEASVIRSVLRAVDEHLWREWDKGRTAAVSATGRVWWSV